MSYIDLTTTLAPATPLSNHVELFVNSSNKHLSTIDDGGTVRDFGGGTITSSIAGNLTLFPSNGTTVSDTYVQNSRNITIGIATQGSRSANLALTIPNPGNAVTSDTFALLGTTQTFSGINTFTGGTGSITLSSSTIAMGANKITGLANGTVSTDAMAYGQNHYLQTPSLRTSITAGTTSTSTTMANLGVSASITPTSSSSQIKITIQVTYAGSTTTTTGAIGVSGTANGNIYTFTNSPARAQGTATQTITCFALDTPGTTSTQTYQIQVAANGSGTASFGNSAATSCGTLILLEEVV